MSGLFKHIVSMGRGLRWRQTLLLLALAVTALVCGPAAAQDLSAAERAQLEAKKEALFQKMLRDPGNLDVAFAYADDSAKLGDNEAAVSALERMLLFNPNLPRVQLELGALYFRMGSYEISRTYFEKALAAKPPDKVKARINTYLAQIARLSATQRFSGYVFFGAQYQSDANIGPSSPTISTPSLLFPTVNLNPQFVKQHDFNVFGATSVLYSYDLGTQSRDTFDIGATAFVNHYTEVTRLDLGLVETTAGPRFNFADPLPGVSAASLKPYLIANDVSLGGNQYFHTLGVGAEATALAWHDVRLKSIFEFRQKNFNDAPDRPLSRSLNGNDKLVSLFIAKPITAVPDSELSFEFDFLDQDTRPLPDPVIPLPYFSNKTYAASVAYRIRYDDPTKYLHFPWETTFFLGRSWADYAAPDPCCNTSGNPLSPSTSERLDRRWRFGVTQSFQVRDNVAVVVQVQRDIVSSNLPLYRYTNNSVLVGPQIRF